MKPYRPIPRHARPAPRYLAVLFAGLALSLSVGLLEVVEYMVSAGAELPSLQHLLSRAGMSMAVFLVVYLAFWLLVAAPAGRLFRLPFRPLAVLAVIFTGLFMSLLVLTHRPLVPRTLAGGIHHLLIAALSFLPAMIGYRAAERLDGRRVEAPPGAGTWAAVAVPVVLLELLALCRVLRGSLESSSPWSLAALPAFAAIAALTVWISRRLPRAVQVGVPAGIFAIFILLAFVPERDLEGAAARPAASGQRHQVPRVIMITVDALRASSLSCYGAHAGATPNIDRLAEGSIVFRNAVSPSPWTLPSFASMMTGYSPLVHGTTRWDSRLPDGFRTIAEAMRDHGYLTAAIGWTPFFSHGLSQGFLQHRFFPERRWRSFGFQQLHRLLPGRFPIAVSSDDLTAKALRWLETNATTDFFFWLHYFDPHLPYAPPARYLPPATPPARVGTSFDSLDEIRRGVFLPSAEERDWIRALYAAEVRYVDDNIGRLMEALKRLGIYDDALILLVSDHGEEFWEHGGFEHGHTVYHELLHVPLLVKLPRSAARGAVPAFVSTEALKSTVLDICGIPEDAREGVALPLTPQWRDPAGDRTPAGPLFATGLVSYEDRIAVIDAGRKYIHWTAEDRWEVYQLDRDPGETQPLEFTGRGEEERARRLIEGYRSRAAELRARLGASVEAERMPASDIEVLRSLGYL